MDIRDIFRQLSKGESISLTDQQALYNLCYKQAVLIPVLARHVGDLATCGPVGGRTICPQCRGEGAHYSHFFSDERQEITMIRDVCQECRGVGFLGPQFQSGRDIQSTKTNGET